MPPERMWTSLLLMGVTAVAAAACQFPDRAPEVVVEWEQPEPAGPPSFEYDLSWPKPLPNNWALGDVRGVAVTRGQPLDPAWQQ